MTVVTMTRTWLESPIGTIEIVGSEKGVRSIQFVEEDFVRSNEEADVPVLQCEKQLKEYFQGYRESFHSFSLAMVATDFQQAVWDAAMHIPFGETVTYGDIAKKIGNEGAARAVGNALNANPLLLIVPCHRILPSAGTKDDCGGFGAGSWRKKWLLEHEQK